MTPLVEDVQKFVVVNLEQPDDLLLGGVLNFLNHFRNIALGLASRAMGSAATGEVALGDDRHLGVRERRTAM